MCVSIFIRKHKFLIFFRYNDLEFMEHFRVRRHIANDLSIHFEASQEFNETTGGHGKITAYNQVCFFLLKF